MGYRKYLDNLVLNDKILGANICVLYGRGKDLYATGLKMEVPRKEEAIIDTMYDTASLTKVLTVMPIVCKLVDNKEISFDTKLKSILPEFKYDDVTIYDILVHQSGLPVDMIDKSQDKETLINEMFELDKIYQTGTNVMYSDVGYMLLGIALERIYNSSLDVISKKEIFEPLEMKDTMYNPTDIIRCAPTEYIDKELGTVYQGVVHDWKARIMEGVAGHAGVFSTASDIGNYMKMVLNNGSYNGKQFISEEIIDKYWFKNLVYEEDAKRYRSLCWITGYNKYIINGEDANTISFHGFSGPSISIDRKNDIGICIMSNSVHPVRENKDKLNAVRPMISEEVYKTLIKSR